MDRGGEDVESAGRVLEGVADTVEEAGGFGRGTKDREEKEEVEESKEEIFGDEGEFDFALGDHALQVGKPWSQPVRSWVVGKVRVGLTKVQVGHSNIK